MHFIFRNPLKTTGSDLNLSATHQSEPRSKLQNLTTDNTNTDCQTLDQNKSGVKTEYSNWTSEKSNSSSDSEITKLKLDIETNINSLALQVEENSSSKLSLNVNNITGGAKANGFHYKKSPPLTPKTNGISNGNVKNRRSVTSVTDECDKKLITTVKNRDITLKNLDTHNKAKETKGKNIIEEEKSLTGKVSSI